MPKLIVAEKPSVAQAIAKALGITKRRDGYLEGRGSPVATSKCQQHLEAPTEPTGETVPDPYKKRRRSGMANRKRNIQMKFWVTEEEKRLIDEKMAQLPTKRYGAYLRKMAIDGYIIQVFSV